MDLALNNLQWLICHKTQPNQPTSTWLDTQDASSWERNLPNFKTDG